MGNNMIRTIKYLSPTLQGSNSMTPSGYYSSDASIKPPYAVSPSERQSTPVFLESSSLKYQVDADGYFVTTSDGAKEDEKKPSEAAHRTDLQEDSEMNLLQLDVPDSLDEPLPSLSPSQKSTHYGHFSPFLARHYAVSVPNKALNGRSTFQSPITNKLSGPFRVSSPAKSHSPAMTQRPLYKPYRKYTDTAANQMHATY